jgi:hypothetical protein
MRCPLRDRLVIPRGALRTMPRGMQASPTHVASQLKSGRWWITSSRETPSARGALRTIGSRTARTVRNLDTCRRVARLCAREPEPSTPRTTRAARSATRHAYLGIPGHTDVADDLESSTQFRAHCRRALYRVIGEQCVNVESIPEVALDPSGKLQLQLPGHHGGLKAIAQCVLPLRVADDDAVNRLVSPLDARRGGPLPSCPRPAVWW